MSVYVLLYSCKVDETLQYHPSNQRSERFSLESFKFIGEHAFVFVHCHVKICNVSDPNSNCVRVCEDRRKRDVSPAVESLGDDVYPLAQGPLSLIKDDDAGRKRASSSIRSAGKWRLIQCIVLILVPRTSAFKMAGRA